MIAHQVLLGEPARALPIGAKIDWDTIVNDDREGRADYRGRVSAGTICTGQDVVQSRLDNHAGAVVFGQFHQFLAEPITVANDRVNEVLCCLALNSDHVLQTGEGVIPRR